jgi:hypothetical protein
MKMNRISVEQIVGVLTQTEAGVTVAEVDPRDRRTVHLRLAGG